MSSEGYRTHGGVTGPMKFKIRRFFSENCAPGVLGPWLPPCNVIDLANTALARRGSANNICMIAAVYRTHSVVTRPMNFKKNQDVFFPESHAPGSLGHVAAILAL